MRSRQGVPGHCGARARAGVERMTKRTLQIAAWVLVALGATLVLGAAVYIFRAAGAERRLEQAIEEIAATGAPVKATDLSKPPIPDPQNAAIVYQEAFDAFQLSDEDTDFVVDVLSGETDLSDAAVGARAEDILSQNWEALRFIYRATTMPRCDFQLDWSKGFDLTFPHLPKLRSCSRLLALESMILAREGHADDALAACAANLRLTKAADDSSLVGTLVQYAVVAISFRSLDAILRDSQPSATACRSLAAQIAAFDFTGSLVEALKGERAAGISLFGKVRDSPDPVKSLRDLADESDDGESSAPAPRQNLFVRWWLASDELTYLDLMERAISEAALPYREVVNIHPSVEESVDTLPRFPPRLVTAILMPVYSRAQMARDRAVAILGLAEISLLLKAHRVEHGAYAESLEKLAGVNGRDLPTDPFSGKPFVYRRDGAGFLIYSWGPNLKDDGGVSPAPQERDEGDMAVRCLR